MLQVTQGLEGFEAKALKALTMFSNSVKVLQQFSKCFRVPFSITSRASYCHSFLLNCWTVRKLGWVFLFWAASEECRRGVVTFQCGLVLICVSATSPVWGHIGNALFTAWSLRDNGHFSWYFTELLMDPLYSK